MRTPWLALLILTAVTAACAAEPDSTASGPGGPFGGSTAGGGAGGDAGAPPVTIIQNPTVVADSGATTVYTDGGTQVGQVNGCVATKAVAPPASNPKIDIVWIVDSSQSMFDEQKRINQNLLAFTEAIAKANLDVSIAMVSQSPSLTGAVNIPLPGLCPELPPDPLAGSPFQMDPRYHFVQTYVNSKDPLNVAISAFPNYSKFLRPGSVVHFIVVTDDEAAYGNQGTPDARAMKFQSDMTMRLGRPFKLHTISSPGPTPCTANSCDIDPNQGIVCVFLAANCQAAASGLTYYSLAKTTQGLTASICETDWTPIFKSFQENIIKSAPLPCDYTIPPPPMGEKLDPKKVNVGYTPAGSTMEEILPNVPNEGGCGANSGWYYDNPGAPGKILLCPSACTKAAQGGAMNIAFGCAIIVLQ